jgi:hypothetical protein
MLGKRNERMTAVILITLAVIGIGAKTRASEERDGFGVDGLVYVVGCNGDEWFMKGTPDGVTLQAVDAKGNVSTTVTDSDGAFTTALTDGTYTLSVARVKTLPETVQVSGPPSRRGLKFVYLHLDAAGGCQK